VLPAESYTLLVNEEERLRSIAFLQQKAQALATEIRERKKAQSDLRIREAELIDFLENAVIGMHWVSADGTILWANKAELDMLGYTLDEYIGHHISEFHADKPVIEDILQRLGRHEELHGYESRLLRKDGSSRSVRIHSNVLVHNGRFVHTRCFTVDITEHKKAEEASARLAAIVQSSDDAIVSKDLNGIVTSWNASAQRIFGYSAEEIIGKSITVIIPPELQDQEPLILAKIRSNERIEHFETVRLTKAGQRIDVSLTVSPVKDERGTIIGVAKIARDISENKRLEQTLRTTEKLASVGRLAASVAHEINNPLEAVTNLLFLAKRDISDRDKVEQRLDLANQELDRVTQIATQTLGFYRETSSASGVDLAKTMEGILVLYARKISGRGINVIKEYGDKTEIRALAGEIRQVLANLVSNSLDAMPNGGSLRLRISGSHSRNNGNQPGVRVIIADTGSGIRPENMKKIFEPFFTTKPDTGTGLGLWITRAIIEKHGGSIRVHSKPGANQSGTVFSIFLPEAGCDISKTATPQTDQAERQDNQLWLVP
jgi:PAS domain S-box-containing protein